MRKDVYSVLGTNEGKFTNEVHNLTPFVCVCVPCQIANTGNLSAQRLGGKNLHSLSHTFLYCLYLLPILIFPELILKILLKKKSHCII